MRVLHFLPVYAPAWQYGGPILSVSRLCEGLVQDGVEVRVLTTNAGLHNFSTEELGVIRDVNGVQVVYYPVDNDRGSIWSSALVEELPVHMDWAELLHLSSIWQPLGLPVQRAAHLSGLPVIQTLRGALGPYSWRRGWWKKVPYFLLKERPWLQRATALHCTTAQEAREIEWLSLRPQIRLLPNSIDFSTLDFNPELGYNWRKSMGISSNEPLLLVAGRLHHKKGLDLLPNVLQKLRHLPWQIVFIGQDDDGTGRKLRISLIRAGLEERSHWLASIPAHQLSGPYNAADCLLLPSRHENYGNVVLEALACGCGVLISDKVGASEIIKDCPGVDIVTRSTEAWIQALAKKLIKNRPGRSSYDFVRTKLSTCNLVNQAIQLYSDLLEYK